MNVERLTQLRDFIRYQVPDDRFDQDCTQSCTIAWGGRLFFGEGHRGDCYQTAEHLGLEYELFSKLYASRGPGVVSRLDCVDALTSIIETGDFEWPEK